MTSRRPALALLTLALVPGLAACGSSGDKKAASGDAAHKAAITVTADKGCTIDNATLAAGGIDFTVKNVDATAVSEVEVLSGDRIVGEKENLPPGFSGSFSVTAPAGDYTLYCPGATPEKSPLKVTGKPPVKRIPDSTLLANQKVVEESGEPSRSTSVRRIVYDRKGNVLFDTVWYSNYLAEPKVVRYGTKAVPTPATTTKPKTTGTSTGTTTGTATN